MKKTNLPKVQVYDNGGRTWDRYTILIDGDVYGMSVNADSPSGYNMYVGNILDPNFYAINPRVDKVVELANLPKSVQTAIGSRLKIYMESENPDKLGD